MKRRAISLLLVLALLLGVLPTAALASQEAAPVGGEPAAETVMAGHEEPEKLTEGGTADETEKTAATDEPVPSSEPEEDDVIEMLSDDPEPAPVPRVGEGSKEREVTKTELSSYTIGDAQKTPKGGIYKTVLPKDAKSIAIDIEGMYAVSDPLDEHAQPVTFDRDEAVFTYSENDATEAVKAAFGEVSLNGAGTADAPLRMLEIYKTEEDSNNGTPYITMLVEYSIERPKVTVSLSEPNANAKLVMDSEELELPYQFWCEGNTIWTQDTSGRYTGTIMIDSWDSDHYAFAGWKINGKEPIGVKEDGTADDVRYGTNNSQDYADFFSDSKDSGGKGSYTLSFTQNYSTKHWQFAWQIYNGAGLIQNMTIQPVFTQKTEMQYEPTVVETEGGTVARSRIGETEEHTLTATPQDGWYFDHWEQSTDAGATWIPMEGGAECNVTLTKDTSYKAVFQKFDFTEMRVKNYALTSTGSDWFLQLDAKLNAPLRDAGKIHIAVYEGENEEGTKLGEAEVNVYSGNQELELRASGLTRPSSPTSEIYVKATLPNGKSESASYTLAGTLDVEPGSFTVDTVAALFLHSEPDSYQLTVTGNPAPETVTYSGGFGNSSMTNNAAWVDETGKISFSRFYRTDNPTFEFFADAGDGRIAVSAGTFKKGADAIKLGVDTVKVAAGTDQEFAPEKSSGVAQLFTSDNTKLISSNEEIFTATITTKSMGRLNNIVDKIVVHGSSERRASNLWS